MKNIVLIISVITNIGLAYFWQQEKVVNQKTASNIQELLTYVENVQVGISSSIEDECRAYLSDYSRQILTDLEEVYKFQSGQIADLQYSTHFDKDKDSVFDSLFYYHHNQFINEANTSNRNIRKSIFIFHVLNKYAYQMLNNCGFDSPSVYLGIKNSFPSIKLHQGDTIKWEVELLEGSELFHSMESQYLNCESLQNVAGKKAQFSFVVPKYNPNGNNAYDIEDQRIMNLFFNKTAYIHPYFLWNGTYEVIP